MEFPTLINWTSSIPFQGLLRGVFNFYSNFNRDPDQVPRSVASDPGLRCLHMPHKKGNGLIWVKVESFQQNRAFALSSIGSSCPCFSQIYLILWKWVKYSRKKRNKIPLMYTLFLLFKLYKTTPH